VAPAALLPTVVVLGLLVLVWAATTGPVRMLHDSGRRYVFAPPPTPSDTAVITPGASGRDITRDVQQQIDLSWLGNVIATALLLAVCVLLFLVLRWGWLHRWRAPERPQEADFDVLPDRLAQAMRDDADAQVLAVDHGTPRNAIVACWLRLQEVAAEAGLPPRTAETSTEFVVRALHTLDLDPRAIGSLAALYREARFSEHELGEDARDDARSALEQLRDDLRSRGAVA
jgi:Domain of unknown function (DUF4129)